MLSDSIFTCPYSKNIYILRFWVFSGIFGAILAQKRVKNLLGAKQKNLPLEIPLRILKNQKEIGMKYDWGPWSLE